MKTETQIKKEISAYLDSLGEKCWHVAYHNIGYGRKGVPDRLVCYRGRFLALEVKRPPEERKKNPEAEKWQAREIAAINVADGVARVVWSVKQVVALISALEDEYQGLSTHVV
jgi:hypothetical protein